MDAAEDDGQGGGSLLAWAGPGDRGGAGAGGSNPRYLDRGCGLVVVVWAGARAGSRRPTLASPKGGADGGGGWCQAGARGWCCGRR